MPRRTEEPKVTRKSLTPGDDNVRYDHPAFGQFAVHKVQGTTTCYGSDFLHHSYVCLTLYRSQHNRNRSHDWYFQNEVIAEWHMSEAQWATFVSSFNVGGGVPVTLEYVANDPEPHKPGLPDPDIRREFSDEVGATVKDSVSRMKSLRKKIVDMGLSKKKQEELLEPLNKAIQEIECNIPFVQKSFDKHVETQVERAKVEVHAYVNNVLVKTGLEALQGKVLQIEDKS